MTGLQRTRGLGGYRPTSILDGDPSPRQLYPIPRITFHFTPPSSNCSVQRKQYPLHLAYACAFDGCLGVTFSRVVIDLRTQPFTDGQLYAALSRTQT